MLKMTTVAAIALIIAFAASPVAAQCTLAVYGDVAGSESLVSPVVGEPFDVYVVLFTEGLVNGVGYTLVLENFDGFFFTDSSFGPDGGGLNFPNDPNNAFTSGAQVGLGLCAVGFGGLPIEVARYTLLATTPASLQSFISLTGNERSSDLDPTVPVYSDCQGVLRSCDVGPQLVIEPPVSDAAESFGAIKSLFN